MSNMSRRKGARNELSVVHELQRHGIPATKRSAMYRPGHDIDAEIRGRRLRIEVKARADFTTLHRWLSGADCLVLRADRKPALVVLPLALAASLVSTTLGEIK
jgi:hypothetical protein